MIILPINIDSIVVNHPQSYYAELVDDRLSYFKDAVQYTVHGELKHWILARDSKAVFLVKADCNGRPHRYFVRFSDDKVAVLFKLSFGGITDD